MCLFAQGQATTPIPAAATANLLVRTHPTSPISQPASVCSPAQQAKALSEIQVPTRALPSALTAYSQTTLREDAFHSVPYQKQRSAMIRTGLAWRHAPPGGSLTTLPGCVLWGAQALTSLIRTGRLVCSHVTKSSQIFPVERVWPAAL